MVAGEEQSDERSLIVKKDVAVISTSRSIVERRKPAGSRVITARKHSIDQTRAVSRRAHSG